MENIQLSIPAIHCGHCVHTIKMELSDLDGVRSVDIDEANKVASISFGPPATEQAIKDVLVEINYPAEE